ncbi:MAG: cation:proton antiporter [Pseudomonadota bacterium]
MTQGVFQEILVLLAVAVLVIALFRRFKLPVIMAYLCVGVLVGQQGMGWLSLSENTHFLAEFGVVFLMFAIGLEFSWPKLLAMRSTVLGLGGAQVAISTLLGGLVAWWLGMSPEGAFAVGGLLAMSSTAIVSKQLTEQLELGSRHGRLAMGVLLFQDVAVIPFLIIIPALAADHAQGALAVSLGTALFKGVLVFLLLLAAGRWLLRPLFRAIAAERSSELFVLTVLLVSLAAAWLTQQAGLSLALGAFLAGMVISETEFRHQVEVDIRPFQDVLLGLFFVTIGMRLNLLILPQIWHWVLLLVAVLVAFKILLVMALSRMAGVERGVGLRAGLCLAQCGEFGFVLLAQAAGYELMSERANQIVLASVLLSMALAPVLIRYNGVLAKRLFTLSYGQNHTHIEDDVRVNAQSMEQHVIICGYGRVGQNIARILEREGINFVALDLDPMRVHEARNAGDPVSYGDCTRQAILEAAGLSRARAVVVSFGDVAPTLRVLEHTRRLRPDMPVLARTRNDTDMERLYDAGATEVVPETLEASLMLSSQLLLLLGTPLSDVIRGIRDVRNDRYSLLRGLFPGREPGAAEGLGSRGERLHTVMLPPDAYAVGRTLADLELDRLGVQVTAVRRSGIRGPQPEPHTRLRAGDVLTLYGSAHALERAEAVLLKG